MITTTLKERTEVLWCGNSRQGNGNGWSFPPRVRRILQSDTAGKSVLHLFGGRSTFGFRMDVDPIVRPDLIGDAWLPPFRRESFDVVILDPPYFTMNAQVKTGLFRAAGYIARERPPTWGDYERRATERFSPPKRPPASSRCAVASCRAGSSDCAA
jgi:hypothetical protein